MGLDQLARNIKFFRDQNGWTQEDLATKMLVSRSVVAKWENNMSTPDVPSLLKLRDYFNVSTDDLVGSQTFEHEILKDVRLKYATDPEKFDQEISEIVEFVIKSPSLKTQLFRMKTLPMRRQQSLQTIFSTIIDQFEQL